jgi:dethiobiotin synthetase
MQRPIFITGIGTDIGKTVISAIITEALCADYWKPVQAGFEEGTDAGWVKQMLSNRSSVVHEEVYKLNTPASPHIAARMDGVVINITTLKEKTLSLLRASPNKLLIIEGAGGLLVPLSEERMVADLIKELNAKVILVSRNYLGSINHSLLTAAYCRANAIDVAGWIFNDDYMQYEDEIVKWSGYPSLGSVPALTKIDPFNIKEQAEQLRTGLLEKLVNS